MDRVDSFQTRRGMMQRLAVGAACWSVPGVFAAKLVETAPMMEGPFYPDKLPLDTDNDLVIINDSLTPAVGEITYLTGRVSTLSGEPALSLRSGRWMPKHPTCIRRASIRRSMMAFFKDTGAS